MTQNIKTSRNSMSKMILAALASAVLGVSSLAVPNTSFAQTTIPSAASYVGFWTNPTEPGWGLDLQQQGNTVFMAWYTYDAVGKPTWFTMSCNLVGNQCNDAVYNVVGKPFSQGLTNLGANATMVGTASLTFNPSGTLAFNYTVQGKSKSIANLTRFNFAPFTQVPVCTQTLTSRANSLNYTDTWWGGTAASGWGLSLSHQGDSIFVAMFTYDDNAKPTWATGLVTKVLGLTATYAGDFSAPAQGTPFSDINNTSATTFPLPKTGSATLTFTSGEAATLDYSLAVGGAMLKSNGSVSLSRFAVGSGATTECSVDGVRNPGGIYPVLTPH